MVDQAPVVDVTMDTTRITMQQRLSALYYDDDVRSAIPGSELLHETVVALHNALSEGDLAAATPTRSR